MQDLSCSVTTEAPSTERDATLLPDTEASGEEVAERSSQVQLLVQLADETELFHTGEKIAYATIPVDGHRENMRARSRDFKLWLLERFYREFRRSPKTQAMQEALLTIEARAVHEGQERSVALRLAGHAGKIYLDLANPDWQAVEIDESGWRVVQDPPVAFVRTRGMEPLPSPKTGGDVHELRQFINASDDLWVLMLSWLMAALNPNGPYPPLVLHGEQGSAKSTGGTVLRRLVDPNRADLRSEPKDTRDLMIAANNGWVLALDNLSRLPPALSDALCRLATGGGFATRELYADDQEVIFQAQRPLILTGIEEIVTRGDLLDRSLIIELPAIPEQLRRPEREFWREFEEARPLILGALLTAVSQGLQRLPIVKLKSLPRMADFATWATACEPGLGFEEGSFMNAYQDNIASSSRLVLEASPIVGPLRAIVPFEGIAQELLEKLCQEAGDSAERQPGWPKGPRVLADMLRRLAPNLRRAGIAVTSYRTATRRLITVDKISSPDVHDDSDDDDDEFSTPQVRVGAVNLGKRGIAPGKALANGNYGVSHPIVTSVTTPIGSPSLLGSPSVPAFSGNGLEPIEGKAEEKFGASTALIAHIGQKVQTPQGEGVLRQVFCPKVRVVLDSTPGKMTDFHVRDITLIS